MKGSAYWNTYRGLAVDITSLVPASFQKSLRAGRGACGIQLRDWADSGWARKTSARKWQ